MRYVGGCGGRFGDSTAAAGGGAHQVSRLSQKTGGIQGETTLLESRNMTSADMPFNVDVNFGPHYKG